MIKHKKLETPIQTTVYKKPLIYVGQVGWSQTLRSCNNGKPDEKGKFSAELEELDHPVFDANYLKMYNICCAISRVRDDIEGLRDEETK